MAVFSVDDAKINSPAAREYYSRADSRIMVGLRAALEMLSIPVPEYARRKPAGRKPAWAADAFKAEHDQGTPRPVSVSVAHDPLGERRIGAAVAKAQARVAKRKGDLFNDTFASDGSAVATRPHNG